MRLIDADELKCVLVKHFDAYFNENGKLMYSDHICTSDDVGDLFNLIDKQPTAYKTENAIDRLNDEADASCENFGKYAEEHAICKTENTFAYGLARAVEIIRECESDGNG